MFQCENVDGSVATIAFQVPERSFREIHSVAWIRVPSRMAPRHMRNAHGRPNGTAGLLGMLVSVSSGRNGFFDGLIDRATEGAKRKAPDHVNQQMHQTIDKAINKSEGAVKSLATDEECLKRAKDEGKTVVLVETLVGSDAVKCRDGHELLQARQKSGEQN